MFDASEFAVNLSRPVQRLRRFRLEVECDGAPFRWEGAAQDEQAAFRLAAHDLAVKFPTVEAQGVQLLACIEVGA